jgi:hypothetical protein
MAEEQATQQDRVVVINGEEHKIADLSAEQIGTLNQVADLESRIRQIAFNLAQAEGGRNYFMSLLTASLSKEPLSSEELEPAPAEAVDGS